ncbi:MAG: DUF6261 family protein [Tannerellaceae bacterium]|jgi:hypothetical protein|nr:DUF6261 family protein [Tannerellaceae bacterium]
MDEIKIQTTVLHRLTYGELFQLCLSISNSTTVHIVNVPRLQSRFNAYKAAFVIFDNSFKRPLGAPETEEIKGLDTKRKYVFILIDDAVRKNAHYAVIAEVEAAAKALLPVFENFAGTPQIEYEGETAAIINLIQELEKTENAARIARLGQTENVAVFKQLNLDFQSLYEARLKNRYDFKQEGNTRQRSRNLIDEFVKLCRTIDGLMLSASDPAEITALKEIISMINALIEQYTIIVHRRLGVKSSKKKEDDKKDDATQTPDTTNPPPPPTDQQNPDTTNPTVKPPTQQPGDIPHHLDPNEHPSMGE